MEREDRIAVPISSLTFVLKGKGRHEVLKIRSVAYRYALDSDRNVWGLWRGIVAALESREERRELPLTLHSKESLGIMEVDVRPGREIADIARYMRKVFGDVKISVRRSPSGYHVAVHVPADHPYVRGLVDLIRREGEPLTYGVHALMNPRMNPLGWAPYVIRRFEHLDMKPKDVLKYAKSAEEARLALERIGLVKRVIEAALGHIETARSAAEESGAGVAIRYLRQIRDRKLEREEDYILAIILDDVVRLLTKTPPPKRGNYAQKVQSRKRAYRLLTREIKRLRLVKKNIEDFLRGISP